MLSSMFGIVWFPCESPLSVFIELMSAIESCKKEYVRKSISPINKKKSIVVLMRLLRPTMIG